MITEQLIKIYFSINIFISGYFFGDSNKQVDNNKKRFYLILFCIALMFFGLPLIILSFIHIGLIELYNMLNSIFQISFFFSFYFTKKWNNLENRQLNNINKISNLKDANSLKNKIYKYCTTLINKRNNYVYNHNPNNSEDYEDYED